MRLRITLLILCFLFAGSLYAKPASKKVAAVDPTPKAKLTVCTITINSDEEIDMFEKYLTKDKFNFVELTNKDDDDWFGTACKAGTKCDILIISGHFAGSFFGDKGFELSAKELEKHSCNNDCTGILDDPVEVFLFGCNTLATKEKDSRTPQEYMNVLIADGRQRGEAELVVAARYNEFERTFKNQAMLSFAEVPHIYGFYSKAPLGKHIQGPLEGYLKNKVDYSKWIKQEQIKRKEVVKRNKEFTCINKNLTECSGMSCNVGVCDETTDYKTLKEQICLFYNDKVTTLQRLTFVRDVFDKGKDYYKNLFSTIVDYFYSIDFLSDTKKYSEAERQEFAKIQAGQTARNELKIFGDGSTLDLMPIFTVRTVYFMNKLNWVSDSDAKALYIKFVSNSFNKTMTREFRFALARDLPGSVKASIGKMLQLSDINSDAFLNSNVILSLANIVPQDQQISLKLVEIMKNSKDPMSFYAASALGEGGIMPQDPQVHLKLAEVLKGNDISARVYALGVLRDVKTPNPEIELMIIECLKDPSAAVRNAATMALAKISPQKKQTQLLLAAMLNDPGENMDPISKTAEWLLSQIAPQDTEVHLKIVEVLKDKGSDPAVRENAALLLGKLKPKDQQVQLLLAEALKDPDHWVVTAVAHALIDIDPQDPKVHLKIAEALKETQPNDKAYVLSVLEKLKPQNTEVQLMIVECLKGPDFGTYSHARSALIEIIPQAPEVLQAIKDIVDDESLPPDIRIYSSDILRITAHGD
jgi:HEAT repeat protein